MEEMQNGIELNQEVLINVLQNKLAQQAIREAQMEAAIQGLIAENSALKAQVPKDKEVTEDASAER